jgi:hypothetical protein
LSRHPDETVDNRYFHYTDSPVPTCIPTLVRFVSPAGVVKSASGSYDGRYESSLGGYCKIAVWLLADQAARLSHAEVNGSRIAPVKTADGTLELAGRGEAGKPLRRRLG